MMLLILSSVSAGLFTHPPPLGGADAYMFYSGFFCFFLFFFRPPQNMRQPFSGTAERIFMKLLPNDRGKCSFQRRTKMGARPRIIFWGLKTTQCALGADAGRIAQISLWWFGIVRRMR